MSNLISCLKRNIPKRIIFFKKKIFCQKKISRIKEQRDEIFEAQRKKGFDSIPIFLISFNRLSYIKSMINCFEKLGKRNIIIVDNASTYPPLLEYYNTLPYKIIRLKKNFGYRAFWECSVFEEYRKNFYIVSDPDIEPIKECPCDFIEKFFNILYKYPFVRKVGFSLKIDDLPTNGVFYKDVIKWEKKFYKTFFKEDNVYYANIDTTFALYVPDQLVVSGFRDAFRTAFPYQARHTPWYKDSSEVTDEDRYYAAHKTNGWWNVVEGKMTPDKE